MPAAPAVIAAWAAVAVTASAATYQAVDANQQRQKAKGEANRQSEQARIMQEDLIKEQKLQQETAAADQAARDKQAADKAADKEITGTGNAARDSARRRQQALRAGSGNRQSTILTSPLGDTGDAAASTKTLLGA